MTSALPAKQSDTHEKNERNDRTVAAVAAVLQAGDGLEHRTLPDVSEAHLALRNATALRALRENLLERDRAHTSTEHTRAADCTVLILYSAISWCVNGFRPSRRNQQ